MYKTIQGNYNLRFSNYTNTNLIIESYLKSQMNRFKENTVIIGERVELTEDKYFD